MEQPKSTEAVLREDILTVQAACVSNQMLHLSRCFTNSPGQSGVVTTSVTCPDGIAKELKARLDQTVEVFFAEHGMEF
jgi:pantothenate kinase type III